MAASAVVPFVSVDEYLAHTFEPDADYVDGVIEERNLGTTDHADIQTQLAYFFRGHQHDWNIRAFTELRTRVSPSRFRVPDVLLMPASWKRTPVVQEPPLLCLEVVSPDDSLAKLRRRAQDFLRMGVPEVWIFDPDTRIAYVLRGETSTSHTEGTLRLAGTPIELNLAELFQVLDN